MCRRIITCLAALLATVEQGQAELKLPAVFSDSMVLQRDQPVKVWGSATAGSDVTVTIGDKHQMATIDASGSWTAKLPPMSAGGPHEMTVTDGSATVSVKDVLVGEVWLCSEQSNMAMTVNRAKDADSEMATVPTFRHLPSAPMTGMRSNKAIGRHGITLGEFARPAARLPLTMLKDADLRTDLPG